MLNVKYIDAYGTDVTTKCQLKYIFAIKWHLSLDWSNFQFFEQLKFGFFLKVSC